MFSRTGYAWVAFAVLSTASGCASLSDELATAETAYDESRYDDASVWLGSLENDSPSMNHDQAAKYYFLRGMTAFRLGQRDDALYFLALARETSGERGEGLRPEWKQSLDRTLQVLTPTTMTWHARAETASQ